MIFKTGNLVKITCDIYFLRTLAFTDENQLFSTKTAGFLLVPVKEDELLLVISTYKNKVYFLTSKNIICYTHVTKNSKKVFEIIL